MAQQTDPEAVAKELIVKMDAMIEEAERQCRDSEEFYRGLGVEQGTAERYLGSGRVPPAEKTRIEKELAEWQDEVERTIRDEQERFRMQSRPARSGALKKGRTMV